MIPQMNVLMVSFVLNIGVGLIIFFFNSEEFFNVGLSFGQWAIRKMARICWLGGRLADESDNQSGEKTEDPSSYRIEEFRKKGDVASSRELTSSIVLGVSFFLISVSMVYLFETFGNFIRFYISLDPKVAFSEAGQSLIFQKALDLIIQSAGPILLTILLVSVITTVSQIGFLFSPDVLTIDFNRVNPVKGFGRLFSMKAIVEP